MVDYQHTVAQGRVARCLYTCNYLVNTPSPHTKDELTTYKSMEGYKYVCASIVYEDNSVVS